MFYTCTPDSLTPEPPIPPAPPKLADADPVTSAAASLVALGELPDAVDSKALSAMERALRHHTIRIEQDDFGGLEMILTCQTQMLHRLFAQSVGKYGKCNNEAEQRLHGAIALKSQNHCRLTVRELSQLKGDKAVRDNNRF